MKPKILLFAALAAMMSVGCGEKTVQQPDPDPSSATSGKVGDLTWNITPEGVLEIAGNGPMPDFIGSGRDMHVTTPWFGKEFSRVVIKPGVTSIGWVAFGMSKNLTSVEIPDSVTEIGGAAFVMCESLASVVIPDGVKYIADSTFYGCSALTDVTIGSSVTSIGMRAFEECISLASITIPSGVTSILDSFVGCKSLTDVTVMATTPPMVGYTDPRNVIFSVEDDTLYVPAGCRNAYRRSEWGWAYLFANIVEQTPASK